MRTETITRNLYQFNELDERAKERARDWYRGGALDYDWWECIYEDAERVGLKIKEFDVDHGRIKADLMLSPKDSAAQIIAEHGKDCDTYKLARRFFLDRHRGTPMDKDEYEQQLAEEYLHILRKEVEYQMSDECVDESILANEYEFDEEGNRA